MISIIIAAYNVGQYIEKCMESIKNQTYSNYEIIIINDGSNDDTKEALKRVNMDYIYIESENRGVSVARNKGLLKASGDYIVFIDPDDYLEKFYLENLRKCFENTNIEIAMCNYKTFYDGFDESTNCKLDVNYNHAYNGIDVGEKMLGLKVSGHLWNKMFLKKKLLENNFLFDEGRAIQDWAPVFYEVCTAKKIIFIEDYLYNYRLRSTSTFHKKNNKLINDYLYARNKILDISTRNKLNNDLIDSFEFRTNLIIWINCIFAGVKNDAYRGANYHKIKILFNKHISLKEKLKFLAINIDIYKFYLKMRGKI